MCDPDLRTVLSDPSWPAVVMETLKVEWQVMVDIDLKLNSSWMLQAANASTVTGRIECWSVITEWVQRKMM